MAVSGGKNPVYPPGSRISLTTSAAVAEGALVEVTGDNTVGPAGAGSRKVVGVALQASSAAGDVIPVQVFGYVITMKASGAINAGDELIAAANGDVSAFAQSGAAYAQAEANNARAIVGVALQAIGNGAKGRCLIGKS